MTTTCKRKKGGGGRTFAIKYCKATQNKARKGSERQNKVRNKEKGKTKCPFPIYISKKPCIDLISDSYPIPSVHDPG